MPSVVGLIAAFLEAAQRTPLWVGALLWMGVACLLNARRCRRTHCHFTGPFFLLMSLLTLLHGLGVVGLGERGWWVLGLGTVLGTVLIWFLSERLWGKFLIDRS